MSSNNTIVKICGAFMVGVLVSIGSLFAAVYLVGPAVRTVFGEPSGYNQDYATGPALVQAIFVRAACLAIGFMFLGVALAKFRVDTQWMAAFLIANPITVGAGYAVYQALWSGRFAGEYFGHGVLGVMAVAAPLIFAPSILLGFRLARSG